MRLASIHDYEVVELVITLALQQKIDFSVSLYERGEV